MLPPSSPTCRSELSSAQAGAAPGIGSPGFGAKVVQLVHNTASQAPLIRWPACFSSLATASRSRDGVTFDKTLPIMVNLLLRHIWRSAVVFYFLAKFEINLVNDKFLKVETSTTSTGGRAICPPAMKLTSTSPLIFPEFKIPQSPHRS